MMYRCFVPDLDSNRPEWAAVWIMNPDEKVGVLNRWFRDSTPEWPISMTFEAMIDATKFWIEISIEKAKELYPHIKIFADIPVDPATYEMYVAERARIGFQPDDGMLRKVWEHCDLDARINMLGQLRVRPTIYPYGDPW